MNKWAAIAGLVLGVFAGAATATCPPPGGHHPAFYDDPALFVAAMDKVSGPEAERPTGITVPHHLLAPKLVADGIGRAQGHEYDRIILLFPDHFDVLSTPFGVLSDGIDTVLGPVPPDPAASALLDVPAVSHGCALARDHGLRALLPFVREYLPGVPVLPLGISIRSRRPDWEAMAAHLEKIATDRTLILQSTDFSHYLPHHEARLRDQETLNVLAAGDLDALSRLVLPDHVDSAGAMYLQLALQDRLHGASPMVVANRNSQEFFATPVPETTSYMVILFTPEPGIRPGPVEGDRYLLAGDTFFGRAIARGLPDELATNRLANVLPTMTRGLPLLVNLEGVVLADMPPDLPHLTLGMPAGLTVEWLERMGVEAVGLSNNHAHDFGPSGLAETRSILGTAGFDAIGTTEHWLRPGLALIALTDLENGRRGTIDNEALSRITVEDPTRATVIFVHWGREFETTPGPRETALAEEMREHGASIIIGAHPHQASKDLSLLGGGETLVLYSLGNFFFDQGAELGSGVLAELTVFPQGTVFLRQHDIPNLYDIARGVSAPRTVAGNRTE